MNAFGERRRRLHETINDTIAIRTRAQSFHLGKLKQPDYESTSWLQTTVFTAYESRGFENIKNPFLIILSTAIAWTTIVKFNAFEDDDDFVKQFQKVESVYLIMFSTLGFLIVFRLSRAAVRFWDCRQAFGNMVIYSRLIADALMVRAEEVSMDKKKSENVKTKIVIACDDCVAWCCAFAVASKQFLRSIDRIPREELIGILQEEDIEKLQKAQHQPLYCFAMMRRCLSRIYVTYDDDDDDDDKKKKEINEIVRDESGRTELAGYLAGLITQEGALERLRATKLPQIYVTHLRTFLIVYCLSIPFVYAVNWGWATIPATALATFALLGVEGAAMECEIPFDANKSNHLRMDQYCETIVNSCAVLAQWGGDDTIELNQGSRKSITLDTIVDEFREISLSRAHSEQINNIATLSKDNNDDNKNVSAAAHSTEHVVNVETENDANNNNSSEPASESTTE